MKLALKVSGMALFHSSGKRGSILAKQVLWDRFPFLVRLCHSLLQSRGARRTGHIMTGGYGMKLTTARTVNRKPTPSTVRYGCQYGRNVGVTPEKPGMCEVP